MSDQLQLERWSRRARFFRTTVILDVVCPIIGSAGLAWLLASGSESVAAFVACGGALGLPGVGTFVDVLAASRR